VTVRSAVQRRWNQLGVVRFQLLADVGGLPLIAIVPIVMYRNMAPVEILWLSLAFKINSFVSAAVGSSFYSFRLSDLTENQPSRQWMRSAGLNSLLYATPTAVLAAVVTASAANVPVFGLVSMSFLLATASSFLAAIVAALRFCLRPFMVFTIENSVLFAGPVLAILLFHTAIAVSFSVAIVAFAVRLWPWPQAFGRSSLSEIVPPALVLHKFAQISCSSVPLLVGLAIVGRVDAFGASQLAAATSLGLVPLLLASSSSGLVARRSHEGKDAEVTPFTLFVVSTVASIVLCIFAMKVLEFFVNSPIDSNKYRVAIYSILFFSVPQAVMNNRRSILDGKGNPRSHTPVAIGFTAVCVTVGMVIQWLTSPAFYFAGATIAGSLVAVLLLWRGRVLLRDPLTPGGPLHIYGNGNQADNDSNLRAE
jgi:hypothetical protein